MNTYILYFVMYPVLAITLFYITNWLGKHSYSLGYNSIDFIVDREDAAAFNFSLRVLTPTIFIILLSAIFYHFKLDFLTLNIYLVVIYSVALRIAINLFMGRLHILDWKLQFFYAVTICVVAYAAYINLILPKKPLIPDFNTISNELWILIGLFVYNVVNKIELSKEKQQKRISHYVMIKYKYFNSLYEHLIDNYWQTALQDIYQQLELKHEETKLLETSIELFKFITYSIMIFEDFNRPKNARRIENFIAKHSSKIKTIGVMQVQSKLLITDIESIYLGMRRIAQSSITYLNNNTYYYSSSLLEIILHDYNNGENYYNSVESILEILFNEINNENLLENWDSIMESINNEKE